MILPMDRGTNIGGTLLVFLSVIGSFCIAFSHKLQRRHYVYAAILGLGLFYLSTIALEALENGQDQWRVTVFIGTLFVTFGWMVTNEISITNARKQHTINIVTDYMINTNRIADRQVIKAKLPKHTDVFTPAVAPYDDEVSAFVQSIDRELNFFEFVAIGLETGDLDQDIVERSFKLMARSFYLQTKDYIEHWQAEDDTIWEHFTRLCARWKTA